MKIILYFILLMMLILPLVSCENKPPEKDLQNAVQLPSPTEILPDNSWEFDAPENHGVDGPLLAKFHDAIKDVEICSVVIVKNEYIIDEYYKQGYDEYSIFRMHSCSKSVMSALIGIALEKGLIGSVDTKLSEYFPEIAASGDGYKQEMTIEHLLEQTSGINWPESSGSMFQQFVRSENWVDFVLSQPMAAKPGSRFNYSTGNSHLLAAIIQQAAGETAYDFGLKYLFEPLGMDSVQWSVDPQGITDGGNGISMSARDAAKFGQLYLAGGKWRNQQIIPEKWIEESTSEHSNGQPGGISKYGYQWWIRNFDQNSVYFAQGHGGQYIFVVPELELVAVITSRLSQNGSLPQTYFNDYILAACRQ